MDERKYFQDRRDAEEDADGLRRVMRQSKLDYRSAREMELLAAGHANRAVIGAMITEERNQPTRVEDWRTEAEGFIQRMRVQTNLLRAEIAMEGEEAWVARVRAERAADPVSDAARVRLLIRLGRVNRSEMTDEARTEVCIALARGSLDRANEAMDGGSDYAWAREHDEASMRRASQDGSGAGRNQGPEDGGGFADIGDRIEADQISVAVTECEIEDRVKAVEAEEEAVHRRRQRYFMLMVASAARAVLARLRQSWNCVALVLMLVLKTAVKV
jgi:hypothetical protein